MKTVLLHCYLIQKGGAEKIFFSFLDIFPKSGIRFIAYDGALFPNSNANIKASFIQLLPFRKKYKMYAPLFPLALKFFRFKNNQLILSSSCAWVKNITKPKNSLHICYCHTPMRYAWDLREEYLKRENILLRPFIALFLSYLRHWDKNGSKNVDFFIANSQNVANRIKKCYNRKSTVIYPPVDTKLLKLNAKKRDGYYLIVSRLVEYKKVDLAIEAFIKLNKKLIIIGAGRDEKRLKKLANSNKNIFFKGFVKDNELLEYYQKAKAFIHPQIEDAGIALLESQSCGTPVIAYAKGGALETVIEGKTGHFFHEQTPEALIKAVKEFEKMKFDPKECRKNALKYDKEIFKKKIKKFVWEKYREWKNQKESANSAFLAKSA